MPYANRCIKRPKRSRIITRAWAGFGLAAVGLAAIGCSEPGQVAPPAARTTAASTSGAGSASYEYDALGRLKRVAYDNGTSIVYSYDAAGNRTSTVTACGSAGCS